MIGLDPPGGDLTNTGAPSTDEFALDPSTVARLDATAREVAGSFLPLDIHDPDYDRRADQLSTIGRRDVEALGDLARRSLQRSSASESATTAAHDRLDELRRIVERLDPGAGETLLKPRMLFGLIPVGEQMTGYFDRYRRAQDAIESVLSGLAAGRDRLLQDNVAIDAERRASRPLIGGLAEAIHLCAALDARFDRLAAQLDPLEPAKAQRMRDSAMFCVRQRHSDLLTHMAVSLQGYQLLGIIRANTIELAKGIDRATATTIAALRTATVAAQTLSDQRLLLDRIAGVTGAASAAIDAAAQPIAAGNARMAQGSAEASAQMAALQQAFGDIYATVDAVDERHLAGLRAMQSTSERLALESR